MAVEQWGCDADRQARAQDLRRRRLRLSAGRTVVSGVAVLALILGGSFRIRDSVLSFHWHSWASSVLFLVLLYALFVAIELPFAFLGGYRLEKAAGMSSQTLGSWWKDFGKAVDLGLEASFVAGGALLWLLAISSWLWL